MIPHNKPSLGVAEQAAAARVLGTGWVAQGAEVEAYEKELCRFFGLPEGHAVVVSSGSSALYLALWALDGNVARVGMPVYSCAALRNATSLVGGQNVYFDCAQGGPNLDLDQVSRSDIDILIAPSMYGIPLNIPQTRSYKLVEDLAQSMGATVGGSRIGLRGDLGVCSFYATKMITSGGQGGAVIGRDKALIDKIRDFREFDCRDDDRPRFNFQMSDLQAAVGRVQLSRLPDFIEVRERWFALYRQAGLELIDDDAPGVRPVRYRIVMRCDQPNRVIEALEAQGVRAIVPIEEFELLDIPADYPNAKELTHSTVSLPAYPGLQKKDVMRIAQIAKSVA
jgi:perosamine synthetase